MNVSAEHQPVSRRGFCLILSSPSGAGKTTLAKMLVASDPKISLSVSVTTRAPRPNETHGEDYFFVSRAEFLAMKEAGGLVEWAEVFGNLYGTPRAPLEVGLAGGNDKLLDIDWQGAASIAKAMPEDVSRVFILPPSRAELIRRIHGRGTDSDEVIAKRLAGADLEMAHWEHYDYVIVNRDIDASLDILRAILTAERNKRARLVLKPFVQTLLAPRQGE